MTVPLPWTAAGMAPRRDYIFENVRRRIRTFFDADGRWLSPPGRNPAPDRRVLIEVALPLLFGTEADRELARGLLLGKHYAPPYNGCAFSSEYAMAVLHGAGDACPADVRDELRRRHAGQVIFYAKKDLQFHGFNDNHPSMATGALVLGGELTGDGDAVAEGRANLLNFRDTFLRRGFMHETNDCYIPHTLYPLAAIAEFSRDPELRSLARDCEARIWIDLVGHWHPNLSRKVGPSARDYTGGRLHPTATNALMWIVFGEGVNQPCHPIADVFDPAPPERSFAWNGDPEDGHWLLGFVSRVAAHPYHVPEAAWRLLRERKYPFTIRGRHEVGHGSESVRRPVVGPKGTNSYEETLLSGVQHMGGRPIDTVQRQEADWAMGTASQRMIGNCPNNNWSVCWRKATPMVRTADQNQLYCSFTVNDKRTTGRHRFRGDPERPEQFVNEGVIHWSDAGRYAGLQEGRASLMLYRPRVLDRGELVSLSTTFVFPLNFGNRFEHVWLGEREIADFRGESDEVCDLFIADGPVFIGLRPLLSRPQECRGPRIVARREEHWGTIDVYGCRYGEPQAFEEIDLARIGGGFLCEVAPRSEFADIGAFREWFGRGEVLDDQFAFMRQVRYRREGLTLGLRYDVMSDTIIYRMVNGREWMPPMFECDGVRLEELPWLTGDASGFDHLDWAKRQAARSVAEHCIEPGRIKG